MNNIKVNHLAVWTCIILMHGFGFLWYGPLFGQQWMDLVKLDMETMQQDSMNAGIWVMNSVAIIVPLYFLSWLLARMNVTSGVQGATIAFLATFSLHHLPLMNANMFAGEPYGLAWITGGYSLVWFTVSGFILGSWTKQK